MALATAIAAANSTQLPTANHSESPPLPQPPPQPTAGDVGTTPPAAEAQATTQRKRRRQSENGNSRRQRARACPPLPLVSLGRPPRLRRGTRTLAWPSTPSTVRRPWARGFCPHGRPWPLGFGLCGRLPRHGVGGFMFNSPSSLVLLKPPPKTHSFPRFRATKINSPGL